MKDFYTAEKKAEAQAIFNKSLQHMRQQKVASRNIVRDSNGFVSSDACAYRGTNGTSCAVGCLIPDDEYDPAIEGKAVGWLLEHGYLPQYKDHGCLLARLQAAHDLYMPGSPDAYLSDKIPPKAFEEYMQHLADLFSLTYLPPESQPA